MSTPPIQMRAVDKSFGAVKALDQLDLEVAEGQVAGFLGPNGAGKSTAIRVLLGLLRADAGSATVLGLHPWRDAVRAHRRLAYVPGDVALWPNLTGGEVIDLLNRLRETVNHKRKAELIERFELDPTKKARTYSKGNRQKVALISALAADVELLILDEPTSGLDPLMESVFTQCVREARDRGTSVLLSSHILAEVEKLCDTVTIIRRGRAVESGTLADLRQLTRSTVVMEVDGDASVLAEHPGVHGLSTEGSRVTFQVDQDQMDPIMRQVADLGVRSLVSNPPSLEELFLRHYGDDLSTPGVPQEAG
ncbi:MAG TPA: ABC transporter ATP-binding protein [Beutenbergiaceae bacterium]|nr:ABC transporter ATP-binding protein [Beutenbergiaceae bacterium]